MDSNLKIRLKHKGLRVSKNTLPLAARIINDKTIEIDLSAYKKLVKDPEIV